MKQKQVIFICIVILVSCLVAHFLAHEQAHIQIFRYYGVSSSLVWIPEEFKLQVFPTGDMSIPADVRLPNSINEAIGYQLAPLFLGVMGLQLVQIIVSMRRFD